MLEMAPSLTLTAPTMIRAHSPTEISYSLLNPSRVPMCISLKVESAEHFAFSGPRNLGKETIMPGHKKEFRLVVVAVGSGFGELELPRLRGFLAGEEAQEPEEMRLHYTGGRIDGKVLVVPL